jgi:N-acetylneuraminic acid mutarotase
MKISKLLLFLFLLAGIMSASCKSDSEEELIGNWIRLGDFDGPARSDACTFVIGDTAYICLGYSNKALKDLWRYNPQDKTWKQRAEFPGTARYCATAFCINGKGYVGLGMSSSETRHRDFYEYDPRTDTWTPIPDFPAEERYFAVGAGIGNKGYVGTGYDGASRLKDFYSYTPSGTGTGTWDQISSYEGGKRDGAATFVIDGKLYLIGGINNETSPTDMQCYDPATGNWTKILELRNTDKTSDDDKYDNIPRSYASTFVINGKGYVTLGLRGGSANNTVFEFDPSTNKWQQKTSHPRHRSYACSFAIPENNPKRGFILTGRSGSSTSSRFDDFWEFMPNDENDTYDD